jgi:hypothetical protein
LGLWGSFIENKRLNYKYLGIFSLSVISIASIMLPYNMRVSGNPLVIPLNKYYQDYFGPKVYALGFGADRGLNWAIDPFPGYSPIEAIINAALNFFSINIELFGWTFGSLLFSMVFLVSGQFRKNDLALLVFILVVIISYSLFWFSGGPDFGARYWFLTIIPWVILTVRGIQIVSRKLEQVETRPKNFDQPSKEQLLPRLPNSSRLGVFVITLCIMTLVNYFPWRVTDKYYHYLNMQADIPKMFDPNQFGNSLIFILGESHPDYASAWAYNPIDSQANAPVFALDVNKQIRQKVLNEYSGRNIWFVAGPSITEGSYQILAGPLSSSQALEWSPTGSNE